MNATRSEKFRILVVGDVISSRTAENSEADRLRRLRGSETPQFGGAANIARIAAGLGATVGFLLLGQVDVATRLRQISHFHSLLPQYSVIIFSDYRHCALIDLNHMVASARRAGKRVLLDLDGGRFGMFTDASLMTSDVGTLRRLVGTWRGERELGLRMTNLLFGSKCEGFLVNRHDSGISLYVPGGVIHFANVVRCDTHYLLAALAVSLKAGASISLGVSEVSDRFDPATSTLALDISRQETMSL